jgi:hypothetical protein
VLVSSAPPVVLEIFASIILAGRMFVGARRPAVEMNLRPTMWRVRVPLAASVAAAVIAAFTAALLASGAWHRPQYDSLFAISFWAGWQVLVPAVAAAAAAASFLFGQKGGERAAGFLSGCGLALLTLFLGAIGIRHGDAPMGAYLGAGAGAGLALAGIVLFTTARLDVRAERAHAMWSSEQPASRRVAIASADVLAILAPIVLALVLGHVSSDWLSDLPAVGSVANGSPGATATANLFAGIQQRGLTLGSASAPVTMTEYIDFSYDGCYFTSQAFPHVVKKYVRDGTVRVVMRPMAVSGHDASRWQTALLAAAQQRKAFDFEALICAKNSGWLDDQMVGSIAASIPGVLVDRLLAERKSAAVEAKAAHFADLARSNKVKYPPLLFFGRTGTRGRRVTVRYAYDPAAVVARAIRKTLAS